MIYPFFTRHFFLLVVPLLVWVPGDVFANEIRLDTNKTKVHIDEEFVVDVVTHADDLINAVEGSVVFPSNLLDVKDIRDGGSVINFWAGRPRVDTRGQINFSGITPGGFSGADQSLFSVVFVAEKAGVAGIELKDIKILKNDGKGTEIVFVSYPASIIVKSGDSAVRKEKVVDTEPPEDFAPVVTHHPNLFGGKYFLVFATQDKNSGVDHYKVREGKLGWYQTVESPYLMKSQKLNKVIYVKAIDKSGNERTVTIEPKNKTLWWKRYLMLGILIPIVVSILRKVL